MRKNCKTAIYLRVSTYDQGKGLKSQEEALKDFCIIKCNNLRVFIEFSGHKAISPDIIFEKKFSS
ncbi:MAG: recombinase family protein [Planctomycetota bacterium]|jgi:DNA invertase Pin-like site-specific DNA recombinase